MKLRDFKVLVERLDDVKLNRLIAVANNERHIRDRERERAARESDKNSYWRYVNDKYVRVG